MTGGFVTLQATGTVLFVDGAWLGMRTTGHGAVPNIIWALKGHAGPDVPDEEPPGDPPVGGGEVLPGPQPPVGTLPGPFPLVMAVVHLRDGDKRVYAETHLNDPVTLYHVKKKPGKLIAVSPITRTLSRNGDFPGMAFDIAFADTDREQRSYAGDNPFRGAYVEVFYWNDASRRAFVEDAFQIGGGRITGHGASGWEYKFTCHDALSQMLAEFSKQPMIPPDKLTAAVFPGLDPALEGKAAPIVLGKIEDLIVSGVNGPQGVVPALLLGGPFNLAGIGGPGVQTDVYLITKGAVPDNAIIDGYYNAPDTPNFRQQIPVAAWGTVVWAPTKPGWFLADNYIDYNGERYTPFFVSRSVSLGGIPVFEALRDGRMLVAFNLHGVVETVGVLGRYIDYPPRIWQWLLMNYAFGRYHTGDYLPMPLLEGTYGVIDSTSVEAVVSAQFNRLPGRYISAYVLGRDGQQRGLFDELGELCQGADMEQGVNRHGQLMLSCEDLTADPEVIFTASRDIEDETFETWIDDGACVNRVEYSHGYVYMPPSAPRPVPAETEPVPTKPVADYPKFQSGVLVAENTPSQVAIDEIATLELKNYVVRESATADDVAARLLLRGVGPSQDGPRMFRFTGGLRLCGSGSAVVELGTVIAYQHPQRIGDDAGLFDICRVLTITDDPMRKRRTLEGLVITDAFALEISAVAMPPQMLGGEGFAGDGDAGDGGDITFVDLAA